MAADLITQFGRLMDHLDPDDNDELLTYFRLLDAMGSEMLAELSPRLLQASAPVKLRMLIVEAAYYHPYPGWISVLSRSLRRESDLNVFDVGVRALTKIGMPEATDELRLLSSLVHDPSKREMISSALRASDPAKAFEHYLSHLFLGSSNPGMANQAAAELRRIVGAEHLESLLVIVYHEDMLISRHALKLITSVYSHDAARFLMAYIMECHQDLLDDRALKEVVGNLKNLPIPELWTALLEQSLVRFDAFGRNELEKIKEAGQESGETGLRLVESLKRWAGSNLDNFLLDAMTLILGGKGSKVQTLFAEAMTGIQSRSRRTPHALDTCASGLEAMVGMGLVEAAEVISLLLQAFKAQTGREPTAKALGSLVDPADAEILDCILGCNDSTLRASALDAIGARKDVRFLEFLLKACKDPIEDVANRMILALGVLPNLEEPVLSLMAAKNIEDIKLGMKIARMNKMSSVVGKVLAFLDQSQREELSMDAVETLGAIGGMERELLDRIHSGQSARMIHALSQALAGQCSEAAAVELCDRVQPLRNPEAWMIAAEGLIQTWGRIGSMPSSASLRLVELIKVAWDEHTSVNWRLRIISALHGGPDCPGFQGSDLAHQEAFVAMFSALAEDKRAIQAWTLDQQSQLQAAIRYLRRGVDMLKGAN